MNEMQRAYFSVIPANVRYDTTIPANAKLLYGEITALCNQHGYCWATNEYFAKQYGVHKKTISDWISKLQKGGYVWSILVYKENSKEVKERRLYIIPPPSNHGEGGSENTDTYPSKHGEGRSEITDTPIHQNTEENNTSFNNTLNNTYEDIKEFFNSTCTNLPQIRGITKRRKETINARIQEYGLDDVKEVIRKTACSSFMNGQNDRNWKVNFDWIMKPNNFIKILEGAYDNRDKQEGEKNSQQVQPKKTKFINFKQRTDIDYEELERKLLNNR